MPPTRRTLLTTLTALPLVAGLTAASPPRRRQVEAEAVIDAVFASAAPTALAAAIIGREGLRWSAARGVRRADSSDPATVADSWHLGSNTKAMTAAVFARLVEQGRTRWALPVTEAFPRLPIDPAWLGATLDDFLHHRAGLLDAEVMGMPWLSTARADPRSLREQRAAIAAAALARPPGGTPGAFAYGNANYVLVGAAIEAITGGSWEDAMRAEVFDPLGIASGGFGPPAGDNAWGHRLSGDRRLPMNPADPGADNPLALGPAGTAHMTLPDYGRFLAAIMEATPGWLSPESLRILTAPAPGEPAYAAGWAVRGGRIAHEGSNTMWHAAVVLVPAQGLGLVTVANDAGPGRVACQQLMQRLMALPSPP
ncbi:MAG TPA: serine hydrolase domain-containing protein [Brevundimonas sp.]|nr:serine hydrolase domain-containing protein [Brevundimonas sp.]